MTNQQHETPEERAARYERGDFEISPDALIQSRDEFREGDPDFELGPADLAELRRLRTPGRPTLSGPAGLGRSPKRQVRLSVELDAALTRRAAAEHRSASEVMRAALEKYLQAS
ncbi:ribbon-helix-helix domain-containing protein [Microbacterium album]|uniref:Ribbon-helix-helix protein CopG domain-containing protein n=1 Tax=Microbacterium album TaxID=2053191 RepID=A0A917II97_9MICO|nr:ribbon-helix-helix domain-containing protein [Microbacterium album]GGH51162.1 hypothetical protein GCM10010921_30410 [Microbacterium album]